MIVIEEDGSVAIRDRDHPAPFDDRYQAHICAETPALEAILGSAPGLEGWAVTVITSKRLALRAVIQRADQAPVPLGRPRPPEWEVHGANGTLEPVVRALLRARAAAGPQSPSVPLALTSPPNGANHA